LIGAPENMVSANQEQADRWKSVTDFRSEITRIARVIWNGLDDYLRDDIGNLLVPGDWIINYPTLEKALKSGLLTVNGCGKPSLCIGALQYDKCEGGL
jgi:hypothetical protein